MKRISLLPLFITGLVTACAPNNGGSLTIESVNLPDVATGCAPSADIVSKTRGRLDLAAGAPPQVAEFYRQIRFSTHFGSAAVAAGSIQLEPPNREKFLARSIHVGYRIEKGTTVEVLPVTDDIPLSFQVGGMSTDNVLVTNILGPKGAAALFNKVPPSATATPTPDDVVHVTLLVELRGVTSGSAAQVRSDTLEYPVDMWNSSCATGAVTAAIHQCPYPGQDGLVSACKP